MSVQPVTYGGVNLSQWLVGISIERTLLPQVDLSSQEVAGRDGDVTTGRRLRALDVTLIATLRGRTATEVSATRHSLAAALDSTTAKALTLPDDPSLRYMALVAGSTDLDRVHTNPRVSITFHVPDAVALGASRSETVGTSSTSVTGGGNRPAWPTVTATPPSGSTEWRITNVTTGAYVEAIGSFDGTRQLTIDMLGETVRYGSLACSFAVASDFFNLASGSQSLRATSQATLTWTERWL